MFANLEDYIRTSYQEAYRRIVDAVSDATELGEREMRRIVETSITRTGEERAARGGHPGRVDSGDMLDAIDKTVAPNSDFSEVRGSFGWLTDLQPYYLWQEMGDDEFNVHFQGMKALDGSFITAREELFKRLREEGFK